MANENSLIEKLSTLNITDKYIHVNVNKEFGELIISHSINGQTILANFEQELTIYKNLFTIDKLDLSIVLESKEFRDFTVLEEYVESLKSTIPGNKKNIFLLFLSNIFNYH